MAYKTKFSYKSGVFQVVTVKLSLKPTSAILDKLIFTFSRSVFSTNKMAQSNYASQSQAFTVDFQPT